MTDLNEIQNLDNDNDDEFSEEELILWQAEQMYQQQQNFYHADFY